MSDDHNANSESLSDATILQNFQQRDAGVQTGPRKFSESIDDQAGDDSHPRAYLNGAVHMMAKTQSPSQGVKHIGEPRQEILDKEIEISLGQRRDDKNFKPVKGTFGQLLNGLLSKHNIGEKDGTCILQGSLSDGQRLAKNVIRNHLVMIDVDNGETIDTVTQTLEDSGLFGVIWTTRSHLKDETEVGEEAFLRWEKKQPTADICDLSPTERIALYLLSEKKYTEALCATITSAESEHLAGGVKYVVKHAPMHRLRILFVLEEPYPFSGPGMSQVERIKGWSTTYATFSDKLELAWDRSCVDPSRLMYLPRRAADTPAELHEIRVIWGDLLTIERMQAGTQATVEDDPLAGFTSPDGGKPKKTFVTPNLMKFIGRYRYDFEVATCLEYLDSNGVRGQRASGPGIHYECPNEHRHTEIKSDDCAFMAINGNDGTEGFTLHCRHSTCIEMSENDRAWYLDMICQKYDIKDAMELREFCPGAGQEQAAVEARGEAIVAEDTAAPGALDARITALGPEASIETITDLLSALALEPSSMQIEAKVTRIAELTGHGRQMIRREYRRLRGIQEENNEGPGEQLAREPANIDKYRGPVLSHWHETAQNSVARNVLLDSLKKKPTVFTRREGGVVRVIENFDGSVLEPVFHPTDWASVIYDHVKFQRIDPDVGDTVDINPPKQVVAFFQGRRDLVLPIIERIVRIPHLGPDGTLRWDKGYDAATRTYLDPSIEFLPVPDVIDDTHLDEAKFWLTEAVRYFPFSDGFNGTDVLPIKTDIVDEDGFAEPNWDRGRSSRMHAFAMIMQPFVRDCIDGPCPAYHIDKSSPGTGAGYLTDVAYIIAEGTRAVAQTMSENSEEFRKAITATLREGASIIFIDNINQKVESGHLAAALTAGVWKDRVLGVSEVCSIPIRATWTMAGNNLSFTPELMRRNIPIRLDASTVNPAKDRVGTKDFKHFPLQAWLMDHRAELIWSIHVLLMNWVQKTDMAWGSKRLNSFDAWAGVFSGIFEAADMTGFLDNLSDYLSEMDEDSSADDTLGRILIEKFGEDPCKVSDIQGVLENPMSDVTIDSLGIKGITPGARAVSLGHHLSKMCKGRTYQPDPADPARKYKLSKRLLHGYAVYQFIRMGAP